MESVACAPPLEALFAAWLKSRRPHQGPQRAANARWFVGQLLEAWKGLSLSDLTEERLGSRFEERRGLAGASLNSERAFLSSFFGWCQRQNLILWSPMGAWPRQPEDTARPQPALSLLEEDQLCDEVRCARPGVVRQYIRFLAATGLRPVTGRRCRVQDITVERGQWYLNLPGRALKNRRGLRMVLSPAAVGCLPKPLPPSGLLFPDLPGRIQFWRIVSAASKAAHLRNVTPKTFRSTWVGRICDAGATVQETMAIQGWRRMNILTTHYWPEVRVERAAELHRKVEAR